MAERHERNPEFLEKIAPYVSNPVFERLKLNQHHNDSIYDHTLRVAYVAWKLGRFFRADEAALLRGALFHDLYFHNWREKEYILNHGWTHPKIALRNAKEHFPPVTELEANIISSHMWPFNFTNPPRFRESVIVAFSDKFVATGEVILMFFNFIGRLLKGKKPD